MLDIDNLTLGEIAKIEELSGSSVSMLAEDESPKGKLLAAMALIAKRRSGHPTFKWNDALALTFEEASEIIGLDEDDDKEPAEKEAPPAPKAGKSPKKP